MASKKNKLREIISEDSSLPTIPSQNQKLHMNSMVSASMKSSFLSPKSNRNLRFSENSDMSIVGEGNSAKKEEGRPLRLKRGSMPLAQSHSNFKIASDKNTVDSSDDLKFHGSTFFNQSSMTRFYKKPESVSERTSHFYNSFEPSYSKKMEMLNIYHKKTLSQVGFKEYTYLKSMAHQKLVSLLQENLELPKDEVERLMQAKNPFSAVFEYQSKNKQEVYMSNQGRSPTHSSPILTPRDSNGTRLLCLWRVADRFELREAQTRVFLNSN